MPITSGLIENIKNRVSNPEYIRENSFSLLQDLSLVLNSRENDRVAQELTLRALEHRDLFGTAVPILDGFTQDLGLYHYLDPEDLNPRDRISYEYHRPLNFEDNIVFHRPQADIYRLLLDGESVALSAPASFGKSLIIDAVIATRHYKNIVIIVPTIALIDETRRRLTLRFKNEFKIITHSSQTPGKKNIYVLTQERYLEFDALDVDFFVIDEFYKLSPGRDDDDRCWLLNQAFYRLAKTGKQFYMLGPGILDLSKDLLNKVKVHFIIEPYHTVVSEVSKVISEGYRLEGLIALCKRLQEPTMIFCSSPTRVTTVVKELIQNDVGVKSPWLGQASKWIADHYHPQWHLPIALENGIGVHHGRIPRALSQFIVRQFNEERLRFLVCTSTLIEGVNTKAKNIIIFDNKIAQKEIDLFTFNNIQGRAGRMFQHFVGHVYIFYDPPQSDLPFVDVPAFSQDAPPSLLIQIDENELTEKSKSKLFKYKDQELLSYETLRANVGIDLDSQLNLAETILSEMNDLHPMLKWTFYPDSDQLLTVCKLIWEHFKGLELGRRSVWSFRQLAFLIGQLSTKPTVKEIIQSQIDFALKRDTQVEIDEVVQSVLDFLRLWAQHHFPRHLMALSRIQQDIFDKAGLQSGNYESYAKSVENLFLDPAIVALDEYGIPIELARKLEGYLKPDSDIDMALMNLKHLNPDRIGLSEFEVELIKDAQLYL